MNRFFITCAAILALSYPGGSKERGKDAGVLWRAPTAISSRDLYYGMGGKEREPGAAPFTFIEEDKDGNSPKFVVRDAKGVKWKVKVGSEARAETAATRLVWAVGYSTDEDYLMPVMNVKGMPVKLSRGEEWVTSDGTVRDARWERMDHEKRGDWHWRHNPFSKTRELDGLRVLMALLNNYDLKDSQNSVYEETGERVYVVSDLGATLGATGSRWPAESRKGVLEKFAKSDFIQKVTPTYVNFAAPSWPFLVGFIPTPPLPYSIFTQPLRLVGRKPVPNTFRQRWIGKRIPIENARWMGSLLKQLSPKQLKDAFRAAHYSPEEVDGFGAAMGKRIAELAAL